MSTKAPPLTKYRYRRRLPHLQKADAAVFVTFCTGGRLVLPEAARDLVLNTASEKAASGHSRARAPVPHEGWKCSLIGVTFASGCKAPFQDRLSLVRPKPTYTLSLFTQSKLRHRSPALTLMLP